MKIIVCFIAFLCVSCAKKEDNVVINKEDFRRAPDIAMIKCEDLKPLENGNFDTVALKLQEVSNLYYKCELKRKSLQDFIENK